ncbi:HAD family acid phosphatase [Mycoplasma zalophidermidis]|uniref:5'-nucleotidase, lipoprotein e(P4) family n=1 Tax=Mycoplasma zalophidermidis TaxID=398174 RepID=A0ABS6DR92_9MOLU|nr:HAD family acid phosphatase [Mycoplasma zalophidermidis]MBU4693523.1 hypothetical protein [Mycoplasma zalophidermidis]MCR8966517.1 hypothetical protein [Mycoplasma zalophidermidis]
MNKKMKFLLVGATTLTTVPTLAAACNNKDNKEVEKLNNQIKDLQKQLNESKQKDISLKQEIEKLNKEEQLELISKLDLTKDEKATLINKLNSGAGIAGAIVWYMRSAEARVQAVQAYKLATIAFDNLKKYADTDKMDYKAVDKKTGLVKNPETGKSVPVVFMDVDETVFVNEYVESWMVVDEHMDWGVVDKEKNITAEDFKDSVDAKGKRRAVPGAIEFINHVFENGGIVMFNSGIRQLQPAIDGISKNLIDAGVKKEYVHDWMFWCSGVKPFLDDKKTKYDPTPWKTAVELFKNEKTTQWATSKNERMNAVNDNTAGWDFSKSQNEAGDKVVTKVIMRIGDDFNDFYDDAYKHLKNMDKTREYYEANLKELFENINGALGVKVTKTKTGEGKTAKVDVKTDKVDWHQFNVQVPGNAMYGGWTRGLNYGTYDKIWKLLNEIKNNSKDNVSETK